MLKTRHRNCRLMANAMTWKQHFPTFPCFPDRLEDFADRLGNRAILDCNNPFTVFSLGETLFAEPKSRVCQALFVRPNTKHEVLARALLKFHTCIRKYTGTIEEKPYQRFSQIYSFAHLLLPHCCHEVWMIICGPPKNPRRSMPWKKQCEAATKNNHETPETIGSRPTGRYFKEKQLAIRKPIVASKASCITKNISNKNEGIKRLEPFGHWCLCVYEHSLSSPWEICGGYTPSHAQSTGWVYQVRCIENGNDNSPNDDDQRLFVHYGWQSLLDW